jgi:hemoglobin
MASVADEAVATPFERLGGADAIRKIVHRFYDLMDADPAYAELRAIHAPDLAPMRHSLAGFLTAWTGGPRHWFEENPGKCMMSAHSGISMNARSAAQWAEAMQRAVADTSPQDAEIAQLFASRLAQMARAMGGA